MLTHLRVALILILSCSATYLACLAQIEPSKKDTESKSESHAAGRTREQEIELGSETAKAGFQNEDEIRDKFNAWKKDPEARLWLERMNYRIEDIVNVEATKPHGEKADVEVRITTKTGQRTEGISIKLVSNPKGFNQIDKRWLKHYAEMWQMPEDVQKTLKQFVGEQPPTQPGRDPRRMFLDEFDEPQRKALIDFFTTNRERIVSDLFSGNGEHAAKWMMVTHKREQPIKKSLHVESKKEPTGDSRPEPPDETESVEETATEDLTANEIDKAAETSDHRQPEWALYTTQQTAEFFGSGAIQITPQGSLKIGRITMQRKGGDNGRESANMLQFKINPVELLELETKR